MEQPGKPEKPNKPKAFLIYAEAFPSDPKKARPGQFTLDQVKKYISRRPLRRPPPRKEP